MNIEYYRYNLEIKRNPKGCGARQFREGALLRTTFEDGLVGFSDCHPWVELGDLPITEQLLRIKHLKKTPLMERSLHFSRCDALARHEKKSLFEGLSIPQSYQLLHIDDPIEEYLEEGITDFKLKTGRDLQKESDLINHWSTNYPPIRLRLDFNERLREEDFIQYWQNLSSTAQSIILYVEDPYPYDQKSWTENQKTLNVSFAADAQAETACHAPESASYLIYKPAKDNPLLLETTSAKVVVTSYLDHPIGQLCAAYTAAQWVNNKKVAIDLCGLLSHRYYVEDEFIKELNVTKGKLRPPSGNGLGYDTLLEALPWKSLSSIG